MLTMGNRGARVKCQSKTKADLAHGLREGSLMGVSRSSFNKKSRATNVCVDRLRPQDDVDEDGDPDGYTVSTEDISE